MGTTSTSIDAPATLCPDWLNSSAAARTHGSTDRAVITIICCVGARELANPLLNSSP